jgi:hypothetical protein
MNIEQVWCYSFEHMWVGCPYRFKDLILLAPAASGKFLGQLRETRAETRFRGLVSARHRERLWPTMLRKLLADVFFQTKRLKSYGLRMVFTGH